jgi:predicted transcriptional regulator
MDRSTTAVILLAVMVLFVSLTLTSEADTFFAPLQNQLDTSQQFALSAPLVLGISAQSSSELNQSTRAEIYCLVQNNPGIHFRGICDALCLSVGMVQYHAGILVSAGFLSVYCDGKMQRYFEAGKYSPKQMKIISLLRHKTRGTILRIISDKKAALHGELASQLSITSQGLTWQIHRLEKEGVIKETNNGLKQTYFINEVDAPLVSELVNVVRC